MREISLPYQLRDVSEGDLEVLRRHRNRLDTRCWLGDDREVSQEQQAAWWASSAGAGYHVVTAHAGLAIVGLVRVTDVSDGAACVGGDVLAWYRGAGLGHAVFDLACAQARLLGAHDLWLKVFLQNTAAVKIYLRAGFSFTPGYEIEPFERVLPGMTKPTKIHYARMEKRQ